LEKVNSPPGAVPMLNALYFETVVAGNNLGEGELPAGRGPHVECAVQHKRRVLENVAIIVNHPDRYPPGLIVAQTEILQDSAVDRIGLHFGGCGARPLHDHRGAPRVCQHEFRVFCQCDALGDLSVLYRFCN